MKDYSLSQPEKTNPDEVPSAVLTNVRQLSERQMMALRHELDNLLNIEISQLNLTEELGLQYRQGKNLLASIESDVKVAPNQKSQVFNAVQSQLEKIIKLRNLVYDQERLKRYESAMLKVLEMKGNEKEQELFLELYGSYLRERGS